MAEAAVPQVEEAAAASVHAGRRRSSWRCCRCHRPQASRCTGTSEIGAAAASWEVATAEAWRAAGSRPRSRPCTRRTRSCPRTGSRPPRASPSSRRCTCHRECKAAARTWRTRRSRGHSTRRLATSCTCRGPGGPHSRWCSPRTRRPRRSRCPSHSPSGSSSAWEAVSVAAARAAPWAARAAPEAEAASSHLEARAPTAAAVEPAERAAEQAAGLAAVARGVATAKAAMGAPTEATETAAAKTAAEESSHPAAQAPVAGPARMAGTARTAAAVALRRVGQ